MNDDERDALEARLLEEPELLARVRATETAFLSGACMPPPRLGLIRATWFTLGAAVGAALVLVGHLFL